MSNNCNASASKGTNAELEAYNPPRTGDKKYLINVDLEGVKGKDEAKWSSRCGALIRCHIPIGYDEWRNVDDYYKNILWQELLVKENPKEKVTRTMVWKAGHINKKSEQVLPSAAKAYALVEEEEEKQKLECSGNEEANTYDLNNDPISKVFGSDRKKNYCRAISSTSSTKQVKLMQASKAITDKNKKEDFRQWSSELQNQMANHVANQVANQVSSQINKALKSFASSFLTMIPGLQHNLNNGNVTPMTETASNLNKSPSNIGVASIPSNEVGSSTRGKQFVMLLSQDVKKDVAKAYIGTQTMCHFREIVPNIEKVVWVTEVLEPEAPIYDGPQNGHYKLCELLDGGFVIWPVFRLRSI